MILLVTGTVLIIYFYCPWYSVLMGEEIKQIVIKKINSIDIGIIIIITQLVMHHMSIAMKQ